MTRTNKANDVPHNNPEVAALMTENQLPKFYGKTGFPDSSPTKTKKDGGGKGNWGQPGAELEELDEFNMNRPRRRSNSNIGSAKFETKSKFEVNEPEPVFEEERHGPLPEDSKNATTDTVTVGEART